MFLKILSFLIVSGNTEGGLTSWICKFSVDDLKTLPSVWRAREKNTAWSRRKARLFVHPQIFFYPSMVYTFFLLSLYKNKYNCAAKEKRTFSTGKILPKFSTTQKPKTFDLTTIEKRVSAAHAKYVYATEPIHSITLSKHTQASQLPQTACTPGTF